jgi:hypothetical protein
MFTSKNHYNQNPDKQITGKSCMDCILTRAFGYQGLFVVVRLACMQPEEAIRVDYKLPKLD